jgi:3',5'-cyclic-AMP phosphodiesterase
MTESTINRRQSLLAMGTAAAGAAMWGTFPGRSFAATENSSAKRVLRIAHLTDVHVQPEKRAGEGLAACLNHVQQLPDKPDLILTGGGGSHGEK